MPSGSSSIDVDSVDARAPRAFATERDEPLDRSLLALEHCLDRPFAGVAHPAADTGTRRSPAEPSRGRTLLARARGRRRDGGWSQANDAVRVDLDVDPVARCRVIDRRDSGLEPTLVVEANDEPDECPGPGGPLDHAVAAALGSAARSPLPGGSPRRLRRSRGRGSGPCRRRVDAPRARPASRPGRRALRA